MSDLFPFKTMLEGRTASAADLAPLAFAGFAHFTAMQVRQGRVRGLDLHLARLRNASQKMFECTRPDEQIRSYLRAVLDGGPEDQSVTVTLFSRNGEFTARGAADDPAILVRTGPPSNGPAGPLRLDVVAHERSMAEIKKVGEAAKTHYLRQAVQRGFDDAVFVTRAAGSAKGQTGILPFGTAKR